MLCAMQENLQKRGDMRLPKRSDFSDEEVVCIKAFLGPWPRALERAGLKPVASRDKQKKRLEKRIARKRMQTEQKRNNQSNHLEVKE